MKQIPIGVDLGESQVKFALCDGGSVRRLVAEPTPDQLVRDGRIVSTEAMSSFLRETAVKHHISGRRCAVVLPSSASFVRRVAMPAMTVDQLELNLPYEFRDYITEEKDKYYYDYAVTAMTPGGDGRPEQMELMAAAASKDLIGDYIDMFRRAGFKLALAAPEVFAYVALLRRYEQAHPKEAGRERCILDLGHSAVRVHIFSGSRFEVTRVVERGGAAVDQAIAGAVNVDEHLARTYQLSNYENCLELEPCRTVYQAAAVEIMRALNFYSYNNPAAALDTAWVCGGGTNNRLLMRQLEETLGLDLRPVSELMPDGAEDPLAAVCPTAVGITQQ